VKRWLLLLPLFVAGLVVAYGATAAVKHRQDTMVTANLQVADGHYQLAVANTGDTTITSFTFAASSTLHVTKIVGTAGSASSSCQVGGSGFTCSATLNPPPCACTAGDNVIVTFDGSGEAAGSRVQIGNYSIVVNGSGSVGTTTTTATTTQTTTTTPQPPPPAHVEKLSGSVGPTAKIALTKSAKAGKAQITVHDMSKKDNFHLSGPGVNKKTGVAWTGKVTWTVMLKKGTYSFRSDAHASLHGTLKAS
jgi:hypothetical protein